LFLHARYGHWLAIAVVPHVAAQQNRQGRAEFLGSVKIRFKLP
jgi:hypothetical protein